MQLDEKISIIEAILFASGDPVEFYRICEAADVEMSDMHKLVALLNDRYSERASALEIIKLDECYQLASRKEYASYIRSAMETRRSATLSPAAMETLTIIAYNQPVTRGFIDDIRGVDTSGVVSSLLEKELIEEAGRLDVPGRPVLFKTTNNFLRCFKLTSLSDLPPLPTDNSQVTFDDVGEQEAE